MKSWKRKRRRQHKEQYYTHKNADISDFGKNYYSRWGKRRQKRDPKNWKDLWYSFTQPWGLKYYRQIEQLKKKTDKKAIVQAIALFDKYPYIESCNGHPCKVTSYTKYGVNDRQLDYSSVSLLNGVADGCSYFHCGVVHLSEADAFERRDFILKYGHLAYQIKYNPTCDWFSSNEKLISWIRSNKYWMVKHPPKEDSPPKGYESYFTPEGEDWIKETFGIDVKQLHPFSQEEEEAYWAFG